MVGLISHVGATYVSEGALYVLIHLHRESERLTYARDIGVSYFLVGVMAVLTYRIRPPWRRVYLAALAVIFAVPLIINPDFTAIGHAAALLIGLACYPLTLHHPLRHHPSAAGGHQRDNRDNPEEGEEAACGTTTASRPFAPRRRRCWQACPTGC